MTTYGPAALAAATTALESAGIPAIGLRPQLIAEAATKPGLTREERIDLTALILDTARGTAARVLDLTVEALTANS